jgi:hypothetical protein
VDVSQTDLLNNLLFLDIYGLSIKMEENKLKLKYPGAYSQNFLFFLANELAK